MSIQLKPWDANRLKEIVNLWNQELDGQFPMRQELFKVNSFEDKNVYTSGSRIAVNDEDKVIGFVVAKKWQEDLHVAIPSDTGWIQVLLVGRDYRYDGIGSALLKHAEEALKETGMKRILLGRDTWHYFPGIPTQDTETIEWFKARGYSLASSNDNDYDMICHYNNSLQPIMPCIAGVEFSILNKEEKVNLLRFMHRCFPGRWEYEAMKYFEKGGDGREFVIAKKNDKIIGFCRINDPDSPFIAQNVNWAPLIDGKMGGIGPLGIDPVERKNGYGLTLVEAATVFLRARNIHSIVIDWTGLTSFYEKLGYEIWKSYSNYQKEIS